MEDTYIHPAMGEMLADDTDWIASSVRVPFAPHPIEVCLSGEEGADGPSADALAGYAWVASHWADVFRLIEDQAFQFYVPYRDAVAGIPQFASGRALVGTEELSSVRVHSKTDFEISLRFAWQEAEDPHLITFYIEEGECRTHSVDG
jgi:hypothetical protein